MSQENHKGERIAKRIARAGLCSRRDAERWIEQGRVQVNGKTLTTPACVVGDQDEIKVDGKALPGASATRLFLYHKPAGLVTTNKDERGRDTIFDHLPDGLPRVVTVGRLDINSEGLLLLTNDGELARFLELPATGWSRRYRVRVHGRVDEKRLAALKDSFTLDGVRYQGIDASLEKTQGSNAWLHVVLREGKNREIRKVMESLDLPVTRLIRTAYGPFNLGTLPKGAAQELKADILKSQIPGYFSSKKNKA